MNMGLFGKIKGNMNHGGIKVHVQAPSSVPGNQVIPVTVTLTADSSQTINSVKAEIKAQVKEQGISMGGMGGGGIGVQDSRSMHQTVAQVESREPFTLAPGETKTVNLQLFIDGNAGSGNPIGQMNNAGGVLGSVLQSVASAAQGFEHINYIYTINASADVQGVSLDPSDKQPIQILPATAVAAPAPQPAQPVDTPQAQQPIAPPIPIVPMPVPTTPMPVQPTQFVDPNATPPQPPQ
jgi:hypothetical protein